jgi:hypothetical protein
VTPSTSSVLTPGQDLALTLTLHNNTDAAVPVGTVDIYLAGLALTCCSACRPRRSSRWEQAPACRSPSPPHPLD